MQIQKSEVYKIEGLSFNSQKEAEEYLAQKQKGELNIQSNIQLLDNVGGEFIPVFDPEEEFIDIFIKQRNKAGGNWEDWVSLIEDKEIRYYEQPLQVLTYDEFMCEFKKYSSIYIGTNEWNSFIRGLILINENAKIPLDWREVIELIGNVQVIPEYIYSD
jgi:hypothetical protein